MAGEIDYTDAINEVVGEQKPAASPNDFSSEINDVMGGDLRASMQYATKQDPETATRRLALSRRTNIPFQVVSTREDSIKQQTEYSSIDFNNLQNEFPLLSDKLKDPAKAAAIRDDISNLSYFERIVRNTKQNFQQASGDVDASNIRLKEMIYDVSGNPAFQPNPIERNTLNLIEKQQSESKDYNLGFVASIPGYTAAAIPTIADTLPQTLLGTAAGAGVGFAIGRNPAAAGVGAVWGSRAGTAFGVGKLETGLAYQELKNLTDENGQPIEKPIAAGGAIATGVVNGLLELVPFEAATAPIRRAFSREAVKKMATSELGKEYLKNIGSLMLAEGATEGLQELSNVVFSEFAKGASTGDFKTLGMKDASDTEGLLKFLSDNSQRILESAKGGAGAGLGLGGFSGGLTYAKQKYDANRAYKNEQEQITQNIEKIKESKVFQRDPELFKEVTQDTLGEQNIYIPASKFQEFFQSEKQLNDFYEAVPEAKQQINEAVDVGGNLVLPANSVLTALAKNPDFSGLQGLMQLNPESLSDKEFSELYSPEFLKNFEDTQAKDLNKADEIQRNIESQISKAGLSPESARLYAKAFGSFYETQSQRLGDSETGKKVLDNAFEKLRIESAQFERQSAAQAVYKIDNLDLVLDRLRKSEKKRLSTLNKVLGKKQERSEEDQKLLSQLEAMGFDINSATNEEIKKAQNQTFNQSPLQKIAEIQAELQKNLDGYLKEAGINIEEKKHVHAPHNLTEKQKLEIAARQEKIIERNLDKFFKDRADFLNEKPTDKKTFFQSGFGIIAKDQELEMKILDKFLKENGIEVKNNEDRKHAYHALKPSQQLEIIRRQQERIAKNLNNYLKDRQFLQGENRGSIKFGTPTGETIISLFEGKDLSTLLHESGHFFLETQREIASLEDAPQQIKDDWAKTLEWLGSKDGELTRDQHEQFARGFEAYLYKGEAPSLELRSVFQRFKSWLVRIYKDIKNLDVKVSKEMSEIFDRMLATDEQIEALKSDPLFKPDPKIAEMLTAAERADYIKRNEKAIQESKDRLMKKTLRQLERQEKKWWKAEKEKITKETTDRFNQSPLYRAVHFLKTGQFLDAETPGYVKPYKMDRTAIKERFDPEMVKYLPEGILGKDGVAPELIAEEFGFSSADEMLFSMANMPNMKEEIKKSVDEEMFSRYGDMLKDGSMEREALDAMQNADRANQIAFELDTIGRKIGGIKESKESYKQKAKEVIGSKKVDNAIKPSQYYIAEIRAAREAGKALGAKDYEKAAKFKREQLLNHYLYREATDARNLTNKALKRFAKYQKLQSAGNVKLDEDYRLKIVELLSNYRLAPKPSEELRLTREALAMWQAEKQDKDGADFIPPVFSDKTHYRDLTFNEFKELNDVVENIASQARHLRSVLIEGQRMELAEVAKEITDKIYENLPIKEQPLNTRDPSADTKYKLENFFFNTIKARTFIREMDGFKDLGTVHNFIMKPIDKAEVEKTKRMRKVSNEMDAIIKKHYPKGISKQKVFVPEIQQSLSQESIITVALNWGNEDNKAKMLEGRKWSEAQVQSILSRMTKNDWNFVQETWDYLNSFWPEISELEKRRTGVAPEKVASAPFSITTKDNETVALKGGYYPLVYDDRTSSTVHNPLSETLSKMMKTFSKPQTKRGHTKERVEGVDQPIRLDIAPLFNHLNSVVTDLTMGEALENSYKILNKFNVRKAITDTLGTNAFKQLDMWLKDLAVGGSLGGAAFDSTIDGLRAGVSVSVMGFKVSTVLAQITGFSHSLVKVGPKYMLKGLVKFLGGGNPMQINRNAAWVFEKSRFMQDRSTTFHRDINDALRLMQKKGEIRGVIAKAGFWPIVKMQMMVDMPTWLGAYEKGLAQFEGDEKKAVEFADTSVIQAQGSGLIKDLSGFERGTTSEATRLSPYVRLFTTFYSYFNTKLNLAYEQTKKTDFRKPTDVARLASDYLLLFWAEAVLGEFLLGRSPDDDEDPLWWNVRLTLQNMAAMLPLMREISSGLQGFDANPAGLRGLNEITKALKTTGSEIGAAVSDEDEVDILKVVESLNSAGGIVFKYPSAQLNIAIRAMEKSEKGEDVAPIDYLIYRKK